MSNKYAIFILTHGRPNNVITYRTLRKQGYTGKIYLVCDNEDGSLVEYKEKYGDEVVVFDKLAVSKTFDTADNFNDRRTIVYARNACFDIAETLGITHFIQLDDDYTQFQTRIDSNGNYGYTHIKDMDTTIDAIFEYLDNTDALSIAMAQGGDFIGGAAGSTAKDLKVRRKCMNSFFCRTDRRFQFLGRVNEDVNTYTRQASTGALFLTTPVLSLVQKQTQTNTGGMTEMYLDSGTYIKSFYTVMYCPSSVIVQYQPSMRRLHHMINWRYTVPCLLSESEKK